MTSAEGEDPDKLLRVWVQDALASKASGQSPKLYDQLVAEVHRLKLNVRGASLSPDPTAPEQLAKLLGVVSCCLATIDERKHEVLLAEILDIPLWQAPLPARRAVLEFVTHAVVANGALVQSSLHTLVYSMLPPPGPAEPDQIPGQRWNPDPVHAEVQDDVLTAVEKVLELVPTSAARLLPLLASNMPHKLRDRNTHCLYLRALFRLAEARGGAGVREGVLLAVVEHLIAVDVEIRWEDIVEVPTEEAKEEVGCTLPGDEEPDIFELEGMSEFELVNGGAEAAAAKMPGGGWEGGGGGMATDAAAAAAALEAGAPLPAVDETADKLDSMMEMTIEHLERRVAAGQLPAAWDTLGSAFERTVLHTHRSKFTQFLIFYLARHAPAPCCRSLLQLLLSRLTDRMQPPITRSACAAYAASFLARAAFVPEPLVVDSLQRMADWCLKYTREEDRRGGLPPIPSASILHTLGSQEANTRHAAFFAACQALLYTLCYHMEPLLNRRTRRQNMQDGGGSVIGGSVIGGAGGLENGAAAAAAAGAALLATTTAAAAQPPTQPPPRTLPEGPEEDQAQVLEACAVALQAIFVDVMPRLLSHNLDPLSSCAHSVVVEFGRQAGALGHPQLHGLVQEWERRRAAAGAAAPSRPLEVFFPFDPYLLRRSSAHLNLPATYVRWRRGHPAGAPRAGLAPNGDPNNDDDADSSGLEVSSDDEEEDDDVALSSPSSSDDDDVSSASSSDDDGDGDDISTSSEEDTDDLRRTRFGSMPDSSLSSGGRRPFGGKRGRLPGALKASLAVGGTGGSPTMGMAIPGGSLSTDNGSPWGMSPTNGHFGSFAPMSYTRE